MGNLQVVRQSSSRKPIFKQHHPSQVKTSRSPRHKLMREENIPRFTNSNRIYKIRQSDAEDTHRHRDGNYYRTDQKMRETQRVFTFNKEKSESKTENNRINNFNDFLFQVKKQMSEKENQHSQKSLPSQRHHGANEEGINGETASNKELKINLRLQNEKFELDKYKKLVERELSKSHSIENISLQTKQQNQKVLVIKYGQYIGKSNNEPKQNNFKQHTQNHASSIDFNTPRAPTPNKHLVEKISTERKQYLQILQQTQRIMKQMQDRTYNLGKLLNLTDKQSDKQSQKQPYRQPKQMATNRISRISQLMSDINHLHSQQIKLQSQIKAAIEDDGSHSQTITLRSSMVVQQRQGSK